jgi:hypothetical protein
MARQEVAFGVSMGPLPPTAEVTMSVSVVMAPSRSHAVEAPGLPAELTAALDRVLAGLPREPTLVILATGSEPLVEDVSTIALEDDRIPVVGAPELVAAVVERGQVPRVQAAALGGCPAALAATVHAARPQARFVGVTVPGLADPAAIEGAAAALRGALETGPDVVLVVSGDLGPVPEQVAGRLRTALAEHDSATLMAVAADHPGLAGVLAPVRLALGIAGARGQPFEVHADRVIGEWLHVVGSVG